MKSLLLIFMHKFFPLAIACDQIFLRNGSISFSPDMESPYIFGTEAAHACNHGFSLVGAATRTCTNENGNIGVWSGDPSTCEREFYINYCS